MVMLTPIEDMSERPAKLVQKSKEETPSSSFGSFSMSSLSGFGKVLSTAVGAENGAITITLLSLVIRFRNKS